MSEGADSARPGGPGDAAGEAPREAVRRIFRDTFWAALVAVVVSAFLAPWRVTLGLALGGALALFNQHWLRGSVEAVFEGATADRPPRMKAARYVLRYAVVAGLVFFAHQTGLVSLVATLAGMCAVVAGLLAEGVRQFYFAIVRREEV
ncbi:MAG TPA: ATP synthase subunit I [Pyrinomonadaceae bacterium]|nr:ATP synthase subunit I [Pyrinomonadaceae bacterium]